MNWTLLQNSLVIALSSTAVALLFGFAVALCLRMAPVRVSRAGFVLAICTLALPPFLVTSSWLHFLGFTGVWRPWLPLNIYTKTGTIWILALLYWPVAFLLLHGRLGALQKEQLEIDAQLRGWQLLRHLILPFCGSALKLAGALIFVLALNNFTVPALLQTKVFPVELWINFNTTFSYRTAFYLALPLLVAPILLLFLLRHSSLSWTAASHGLLPSGFAQKLGRPMAVMLCALSVLVYFVSFALPLTDLLFDAKTWSSLGSVLSTAGLPASRSFLFAAVSATVCLLAGAALCRSSFGMAWWPLFFMPGVLLGIGLIFLINRPALALIYQSSAIVIIAFSLRYMALGWASCRIAAKSVDHNLVDAARMDGASGWTLFRVAYWPQASLAILSGWQVVYLFCLWDVETLTLIVPPGGETLALRIFNFLHYGHTAQVNALSLILLGLAVGPVLLIWGWNTVVRPRISALPLLGCGLGLLCAPGCTASPENENEIKIQSQFFTGVRVIGSRGTGAGQFNKPRSVALDRDDNLYVVDMTGRLQKFSRDGVYLASWQMPESDKGKAKGMCTDRAGNIVLVEPHYSRVNHFRPDGSLSQQWGVNGTNEGNLMFPRAVAVNSRGELFVAEYGLVERIQGFSPDGKKLLAAFGRRGELPGEYNRAEGLGIDSRDRLYIADSCNHRIQIQTADGKVVRTYGTPGLGKGELNYPYDVRVDPEGNQFVCEFGNSRIQIFDASDRPVEIIGSLGRAPGQFHNPWGIALDSKGDLYVADASNHRVQKFFRKQRSTH